jgi:hypothetical protein
MRSMRRLGTSSAIYGASLSDLLGCPLSSLTAPLITRKADFSSNAASKVATTTSGQPDCNNQTPPAARNTERFEAMSLREHSKTELMLMSSLLCCHKSHRQNPLAAKPAKLKAPMTSKEGTIGLNSFEATCPTTTNAPNKIRSPLNKATRALAPAFCATTYRLKPYVTASPRLSRLSDSSAVDFP